MINILRIPRLACTYAECLEKRQSRDVGLSRSFLAIGVHNIQTGTNTAIAWLSGDPGQKQGRIYELQQQWIPRARVSVFWEHPGPGVWVCMSQRRSQSPQQPSLRKHQRKKARMSKLGPGTLWYKSKILQITTILLLVSWTYNLEITYVCSLYFSLSLSLSLSLSQMLN